MLANFHPVQCKPSRAVVLGAGGFIGGTLAGHLCMLGLDVVKLGRRDLDLLAVDASSRLAEMLRAGDALVFVSAQAPCKNTAMFLDNIRMAETVCGALKLKPVAHVVYVSSDAVYKDSDTLISEASCAEAGSLHGIMHLAREVMLRTEYSGPLALVRPTLVYGIDDPHNGYGPNRFVRLAAAGKAITLFGKGEERRDHVAVGDIALLIGQILLHRSTGIVNAVSGETASFRELAEFAAGQFNPRVEILEIPRSGPMPHNGYRPFALSAALQLFPEFAFTPWRKGLANVCVQIQNTKEQ